MSNKPQLSKKQAIDLLWRKGKLSWKLDNCQKELYKIFYESPHKVQTWLLARRSGKCLKKGTLIMTPAGPKPIEEFKEGDIVYGYNLDGTASPARVLELIHSGKKQVRDLINHNRVLETSTDDHKWLFSDYLSRPTEMKLEEAHGRTIKLHRIEVDIPCGKVHEPHAYAIGALLGDGCSRQNSKYKKIYISSEDNVVPMAVGVALNVPHVVRNSVKNYTWSIGNGFGHEIGYPKVECHYYDEWMRHRYAHEKIVDLNVIKQWDRTSCLRLLAGLIDTDGSVHLGKSENTLVIQLGMQAKSVIEAVKYLVLTLFQYEASIRVDSRAKYKNGPVHYISIKNNAVSKRILKELDPYIVTARKKWKPSYETLPERNFRKNRVGFKLSDYYEAECFDLSIDNQTHLYLTAKGFVTHNSYCLCILALEQCLKQPNSIVKMVSPTKMQVANNIRPLFRQILMDCPQDLKPEFRSKDYIYYFPNGSEIHLSGTDSGHAEKLRGGDSHVWFVDEAGSCSDLENVVKSILLPTTLITKGKGVLASTPPKESEHEFLKFIEEAESNGVLTKKTIYDNPRISKEDIADAIREAGGVQTEYFRREFLCEIIKDSSTSVIPEFNEELEKQIVKEWPRPPFFDAYESMDLGFKDLTVVLFAYFDFRADKVVIEDEYSSVSNDMQLPALMSGIKDKELSLWFNHLTNEPKKVYMRVSDINYIVTNEISRASGNQINFMPAKKDDKDAALNTLRVMLSAKKIIIHPRCKNLIRHLKNVKWKSTNDKTKFGRSPDNGHYDAVDALLYLVRAISYSKNPYPANYGMNMKDLYVANPDRFSRSETQLSTYRKIFNIKPKKAF